MKMYGGLQRKLHAFLPSALDVGEWSASRPGRFTLREKATGTHWIGGWVGPRAVLDIAVVQYQQIKMILTLKLKSQTSYVNVYYSVQNIYCHCFKLNWQYTERTVYLSLWISENLEQEMEAMVCEQLT
jgi:hypothetical protein